MRQNGLENSVCGDVRSDQEGLGADLPQGLRSDLPDADADRLLRDRSVDLYELPDPACAGKDQITSLVQLRTGQPGRLQIGAEAVQGDIRHSVALRQPLGQLLGAEAGAEQEAVRAVRPGGAAEGLSQIPAGVVLRAEVGPDAVFPQPRGGRRANNRKAASAQLPQVDAGLSQPVSTTQWRPEHRVRRSNARGSSTTSMGRASKT